MVILWPFVKFCVHLVHFFQVWYQAPKKSGNPVRDLIQDERTQGLLSITWLPKIPQAKCKTEIPAFSIFRGAAGTESS
jgi:hypothetical protein